MKISISQKSERSGFALLMVLFTLVAMIMVFASTMMWMSSSVKQTAENTMFTTSQAAAEGATEMAFAEMDRDFLLNVLQQWPDRLYQHR
jgi:flagellar basal body-associated protein FliL